MTAEDLYFTVGDTAEPLTGVVSADLTGATIEVHTERPDKTVIVTVGATSDPASGRWSTAYAAGDLNASGTYYVEVQVTFSDGGIQTFKRHPDTGQFVRFFVDPQYA